MATTTTTTTTTTAPTATATATATATTTTTSSSSTSTSTTTSTTSTAPTAAITATNTSATTTATIWVSGHIRDTTSGSYYPPTQESGLEVYRPGLSGTALCFIARTHQATIILGAWLHSCTMLQDQHLEIYNSTSWPCHNTQIHIIHQATGESEKEKVVPLSNLGALLGGSKNLFTSADLVFQQHCLTFVASFHSQHSDKLQWWLLQRLNWFLAILNWRMPAYLCCYLGVYIFVLCAVPCTTPSANGGAAMVNGCHMPKQWPTL